MLRKFVSLVKTPRRFVHALYITGDKAISNVLVLTPLLEYDKRLANRNEIVNNIERRRLSNVIDVNNLYALWEENQEMQAKRLELERRRSQVSRLRHSTSKLPATESRDKAVEQYDSEGQSLRNELKSIRNDLYKVEGEFINQFLALPNHIHKDTPDEASVVSVFKEAPTKQSEHHLTDETQIDYYNETAFYLKNDAAQFDLYFPMNCIDYLRSRGFVHFSNPDFARTLIVEGAAESLDSVYEVRHHLNEKCTNLVHLVGNGSMMSFLGFISKLTVYPTQLPLQWVATGKVYVPKKSSDLGLLDACQSTAVQIFRAGTKEQMEEQFANTLDLLCELYKRLNVHFRVVYVPASELAYAECRKVRVEMYSPHFQRYFEIGSVSNYSDYISKRILFNYEQDKKSQFPHIVGATVCNVTRLIAILLESNVSLKLTETVIC